MAQADPIAKNVTNNGWHQETTINERGYCWVSHSLYGYPGPFLLLGLDIN